MKKLRFAVVFSIALCGYSSIPVARAEAPINQVPRKSPLVKFRITLPTPRDLKDPYLARKFEKQQALLSQLAGGENLVNLVREIETNAQDIRLHQLELPAFSHSGPPDDQDCNDEVEGAADYELKI